MSNRSNQNNSNSKKQEGKDKEETQKKIICVSLENTFDNQDEFIIDYFSTQHPHLKNITMNDRGSPYLHKNFPKESTKIVEGICQGNYPYSQVKPFKGALKAISEMRRFELLEVYLLISPKRINLSPDQISEQIKWIGQYCGKSWKNIIIASDKSLLKCDYLIDASPDPTNGSCTLPLWEHIIFDQPWNRFVKEKRRLTDWSDWKVLFGFLDEDDETEVPVFVHGSQDSLDVDTLYLFPKMPDHMKCVKFCSGRKDDRNIITVKDGAVYQTFKGPPDELNNELLDTYPLHKQNFPLPIQSRVHRIILPKLVHAVKYILFRISHHAEQSLKILLKKTLSIPNFQSWTETLRQIDFTTFTLNSDEYKLISFQYAQTLALINGKEIYSKSSASQLFPALEPFLYRKDVSSLRSTLNDHTQYLLESCKELSFSGHGALHIFYAPQKASAQNQLYFQTNGIVVNLVDAERPILVYPFAHSGKAPSTPDWPVDDPPTLNYPDILISPFVFESKLYLATGSEFKNDLTPAEYLKEKLNWEEYYHIFTIEKESLVLVGLRTCHKMQIASAETVIRYANSKEIPFWSGLEEIKKSEGSSSILLEEK